MADLEFQYLDFADELDRVRETNDINPAAWRALRMVAKAHLQGESIRTLDLMSMDEIASPATIHKIIKHLTEIGMIVIRADKHDGRVKYLIPSARSLKLFRSLVDKMHSSLSANY
jgi:DNA-binding MarR family transcriptional regulator